MSVPRPALVKGQSSIDALWARVSDPALCQTVVGHGSPDPALCQTEGLHAIDPSLED